MFVYMFAKARHYWYVLFRSRSWSHSFLFLRVPFLLNLPRDPSWFSRTPWEIYRSGQRLYLRMSRTPKCRRQSHLDVDYKSIHILWEWLVRNPWNCWLSKQPKVLKILFSVQMNVCWWCVVVNNWVQKKIHWCKKLCKEGAQSLQRPILQPDSLIIRSS